MENKQPKIAITAFLILIVATTEMPALLKYSLLLVATISFIITATQLYHEHKAKGSSYKAKK